LKAFIERPSKKLLLQRVITTARLRQSKLILPVITSAAKIQKKVLAAKVLCLL